MSTMPKSPGRISVNRIGEAYDQIGPEFLNSPQFVSNELSRALGAELLCKVETQNPVASFKGRGAGYFMQCLGPVGAGLMAASAGNFGRGLAYAAKLHGVHLDIFAAKTANPIKLERIRSLGASVTLVGDDLDDAKEHARRVAEVEGAIFVEDGREPAITEGAGTIGLELTGYSRPINTVVVPLGNGALLAGIGHWFRRHSANTTIIGVCAEGAPAMALSWQSQQIQATESVCTIADGIAVRIPIPEALTDLNGVVDKIVTVSDEAIRTGMRLLFAHLGLAVEPAGAAGVAAILSHPSLFTTGLVATIITGGNVSLTDAREWYFEN